MRRIQIALVAFVQGLTVVRLASAYSGLSLSDSHALGVAFTQCSGILTIGLMAFDNLPAIHPSWLEPVPDKMYRRHKWLGIGGLAVGVIHWLTASGEGHGPDAAATAATATNAMTAAAETAAETAAATGNSVLDWIATQHGIGHGVAQPAL